MSSSALEPAADPLVDLGPRGEGEWQRLRYQIENADAFWLGFVFTPDPRVARQLRRRTESLLRARARALRVLRPSAPENLQLGLVQLFDEESSRVGFVWLEALQVDPPGASERGPWMAAWDRLLLRLNERRDRLRRNLRGGAVVAASPAVKRRIQRAAPDLWSIRTVVAEVPSSRREGRRRIELYGETPQTLGDLKISLEKVASIRAKLDDPAGAAEARDHASCLEERLAEIRKGIEPTE